jgi:hypothetical protein
VYHASLLLSDPPVAFLSYFRFVTPYRSQLSVQFTRQLFDVIGSPDLGLALPVGAASSQSKRDSLGNLLAAMPNLLPIAV